MFGERPRGALRLGCRAGRRSGPLARRRADNSPPAELSRTGVALAAAQRGGRGRCRRTWRDHGPDGGPHDLRPSVQRRLVVVSDGHGAAQPVEVDPTRPLRAGRSVRRPGLVGRTRRGHRLVRLPGGPPPDPTDRDGGGRLGRSDCHPYSFLDSGANYGRGITALCGARVSASGRRFARLWLLGACQNGDTPG